MPTETSGRKQRSFLSNLWRGTRLAMLRTNPAKLLVVGYAGYMLAGWLLLSLPFAHEGTVEAIDNFFIAVSAVSTTGLVTVDPGSNYSFFGELIIDRKSTRLNSSHRT